MDLQKSFNTVKKQVSKTLKNIKGGIKIGGFISRRRPGQNSSRRQTTRKGKGKGSRRKSASSKSSILGLW